MQIRYWVPAGGDSSTISTLLPPPATTEERLHTCHYAESLPASRRSLRTAGLAGASRSNHSVRRAGPEPPCRQDCCIYWSRRMTTSFPVSQRGCCLSVPGSMSAPRVWTHNKVLTETQCDCQPLGGGAPSCFRRVSVRQVQTRWKTVEQRPSGGPGSLCLFPAFLNYRLLFI